MGRKLGIAAFGIIALLVLGLVATAGGRGYLAELSARAGEQASGAPAATVFELQSIEQMQTAFNDAAGQPRLILLLSPT